MFHLLLQEEFQTATAVFKLKECAIQIHRNLVNTAEASRQAEEYAREIEGTWLYLTEEANNGRIGQDIMAQCDSQMRCRWDDTFSRAQQQGKSCRLRLEGINVRLKELWSGKGAESLPMSLITSRQRISLNLMEALNRLTKRSSFNDACARLKVKVKARRSSATSSQEYLYTKDVRAVLKDLKIQGRNAQGERDSSVVPLPDEGPGDGLRDHVTIRKKRKAIDSSYYGQSKKSRTAQTGTLNVMAGTPACETPVTLKAGSEYEEEDAPINAVKHSNSSTLSPEVEAGQSRQSPLIVIGHHLETFQVRRAIHPLTEIWHVLLLTHKAIPLQ